MKEGFAVPSVFGSELSIAQSPEFEVGAYHLSLYLRKREIIQPPNRAVELPRLLGEVCTRKPGRQVLDYDDVSQYQKRPNPHRLRKGNKSTGVFPIGPQRERA